VEGTLKGDCSTTWELGLEITMPDDASIDIGPISLPLPDTITFGYYKDPETTTLTLGFEFDMFSINFMTDKVGRCRLPVSKPVLKARLVSALDARL